MPRKAPPPARGLDALFSGAAAVPATLDENGIKEGSATLRVSLIEPKPGQPRKNFDDEALAQLAESIAEHGVLQPILVRPISDTGRYQIIAGERRWRAARLAGLTEIPVVVMEKDDFKAAQLSLIENIQRENLNPIEEAAAYRALIDQYNMTQEEVAARLGRSRSAVTNSLRLLDLPPQLIPMVSDGRLSVGLARALLGLRNPEAMALAAERAVAEGWSVRTAEEQVRRALKAAEKAEKEAQKAEDTPRPVVNYEEELEHLMMRELGRRVKITATRNKKTLTLYYEDNDDLQTLLRLLCGEDFVNQI